MWIRRQVCVCYISPDWVIPGGPVIIHLLTGDTCKDVSKIWQVFNGVGIGNVDPLVMHWRNIIAVIKLNYCSRCCCTIGHSGIAEHKRSIEQRRKRSKSKNSDNAVSEYLFFCAEKRDQTRFYPRQVFHSFCGKNFKRLQCSPSSSFSAKIRRK